MNARSTHDPCVGVIFSFKSKNEKMIAKNGDSYSESKHLLPEDDQSHKSYREFPACQCTTKEKRSPVLFLNSWYHMLSGQNDRRKNSCYQVTKKALLHRWKISCQTHAHIHTCKEKCRQDDHDHSFYIIFLFHI